MIIIMKFTNSIKYNYKIYKNNNNNNCSKLTLVPELTFNSSYKLKFIQINTFYNSHAVLQSLRDKKAKILIAVKNDNELMFFNVKNDIVSDHDSHTIHVFFFLKTLNLNRIIFYLLFFLKIEI
jgi:hypothetical protein